MRVDSDQAAAIAEATVAVLSLWMCKELGYETKQKEDPVSRCDRGRLRGRAGTESPEKANASKHEIEREREREGRLSQQLRTQSR
jgi:hypothetical protein